MDRIRTLALVLYPYLLFSFTFVVFSSGASAERLVPVPVDRIRSIDNVFGIYPLGNRNVTSQALTTYAVSTRVLPMIQCDVKWHFNSGPDTDGLPQCISLMWRCDGELDCRSGADENDCDWKDNQNQECTNDTYQCGDGTCIHPSWICDSDLDCSDASDEANCTQPVNKPAGGCGTFRFACANSERCIPLEWKCDSQSDCSDGSDEIDCSALPLTSAYRKNVGERVSYKHTVHNLGEPFDTDEILLPVQNIMMSFMNHTCAVLKWARPPVSAVISDYFVQEASEQIKSFRTNGSTRADVCNLRAGLAYTFHVKAMNRKYKSPTAEVHGTVPDRALSPPVNLNVTRLDSKTIALTWELPPEIPMSSRVAVYYCMQYLNLLVDEGSWKKIVVVNRTGTVVSGLRSCKAYIFKVRIEGPTVYSEFSEWYGTKRAKAPTNVRVETAKCRRRLAVVAEEKAYPNHDGSLVLKVTFQVLKVTFQTEPYDAPDGFNAYQAKNGSFILSWSRPKNSTGTTHKYLVSMRKNISAGQNHVASVNYDYYTTRDDSLGISIPVVVGEEYLFHVQVAAFSNRDLDDFLLDVVGEPTPEQSVIVEYGTTTSPTTDTPRDYVEPSSTRKPYSSAKYSVPSVVLVIASLLLALSKD